MDEEMLREARDCVKEQIRISRLVDGATHFSLHKWSGVCGDSQRIQNGFLTLATVWSIQL